MSPRIPYVFISLLIVIFVIPPAKNHYDLPRQSSEIRHYIYEVHSNGGDKVKLAKADSFFEEGNRKFLVGTNESRSQAFVLWTLAKNWADSSMVKDSTHF